MNDPNFGCPVSTRENPKHKIGLSGYHFYLISIFYFEGKDYFYLRNPCGQFDFRGTLKEVSYSLEQHIFKGTGLAIAPGNFLLT